MNSYWENITKIQQKQERKGHREYGMALEDNKGLTTQERLTMLEEELIDALMYIEHLKADDKYGVNPYQE